MALSVNKPYTTAQGIDLDTTYWRWVGVGIDVTTLTLTTTLYGYKDGQAFLDKLQPVGTKQFTLTGQEFGAAVMNPPVGDTLSDALSNAIYAYARVSDDLFGEADSVE